MEDDVKGIKVANLEADKQRVKTLMLSNLYADYESMEGKRKGVKARRKGKKVREYRALKNFFSGGKLIPAEWKAKQSLLIREPVEEEYNERKKVGRPARKRIADVDLSSSTDTSVATKICKGVGSSVIRAMNTRR